MSETVVSPSAEGSVADCCWAKEDSVMQSESSDLRSPTAARQRGWDVLGVARARPRLQSHRASPNLVPGSARPHRLHVICLVYASSRAEAQPDHVRRSGEQCWPDFLR